MSRYLATLVLGCFFALANSAHAQVTCPTLNNLSPNFNSPEQVFGRLDSQWNSYYASKADANNGVLCNPTFGGNVSMQSLTITGQFHANNGGSLAGLSVTGLPSPNNSTDAATKGYVDNILTSGIAYHTPVALGTTAALPANTYNNGTSGVGATLTGNSFGALTVDGSSATVSQRLLVKNESDQTHNGVYSVTATGGAAADYVLTRVTDFDTTATMLTNASFLVTGGSTLTGSAWALSTPNPVIPGTSSITFVQTALQGQAYSAGAGLTLTGNTFSVPSAGITASMLASGAAASNLGYTPLKPANNLSDVSSATASRSSLGLGSLATLSALPNPSSSTLGGAQSFTAPAGQALAGLTTSGTWTTVALGGGSNPGGASGQLQYNNAGALGGFTPSGACTVVVTSGVFTCFGTSASSLAFSDITGQTTLAQLPNIGVGFLGNSAGTAVPSLLTATQATALLNACTATLKGEVPLPPNSASQFLNGTCAWSTPSGAGNFSGPAGATSNDLISFSGTSGTLGQDSGIGQATVLTTTNGNTLAASRISGQLILAQLPSIGVGFLGNTSGTAPPSVLTAAQATAALVGCSTSAQGVVPSPTGNAGQYLNGTCGWSTPPGGVSVSGTPTSGNIASFSGPSALQDSAIAASTLITTANSATLPTTRLSGTISAAQMLPLPSGQVYLGNGTSQPAASTLAFSNISGSLPLSQIQGVTVGLLGNLSGTAAPSLLTMTQVTAALNVCVAATQGLVPNPTGNASAYLNGQCAWTVPPAGGNFSGPNGGVTAGDLISFNGTAGTLGQDSGLAAASVVTTTNALTLPLSRTTGSLNAGQMLPLQSGQVYIGNISGQPVSSALAFTNVTGSLQLSQIQTIGAGFLGNSSGTAAPTLLSPAQATTLLGANGVVTTGNLATTLASPPAIGGTTPAAASFTTGLVGTNNASNNYIANQISGTTTTAQFVGLNALNGVGGSGVLGGCQTTTGPSPVDCFAVSGFALLNGSQSGQAAWGLFGQSRHYVAKGTSQSQELDSINLSGFAPSASYPYAVVGDSSTHPFVINDWLACGDPSNFLAGQVVGDCSVALGVINNGVIGHQDTGGGFLKGIVFQNIAIRGTTGADADTTPVDAISLSRMQGISFYNTGDTTTPSDRIYSATTSAAPIATNLRFDNAGATFEYGGDGTWQFQVRPVVGATDYVYTSGGTLSTPAGIAVASARASAGLNIGVNTSGSIGFYSGTTLDGQFVNGYFAYPTPLPTGTASSSACFTSAGFLIGCTLAGNVNGPNSSVSGHLASFSDASGKLLQDSGIASSAIITTANLATQLASPPSIGGTTPAAGAFTTLSSNGSAVITASSLATQLASPPAIGGTTPAAGAFTTLSTKGIDNFYGSDASLQFQINPQTAATDYITLNGGTASAAAGIGVSSSRSDAGLVFGIPANGGFGFYAGTTQVLGASAAGVSISGGLYLSPATWADNQTCTAGQITVDANFIYVCTSANVVKRAALSAF